MTHVIAQQADQQEPAISSVLHAGIAAPADQAGEGLRGLLQSPLYQVRRILRVTQVNWVLPMARGKRAARLARRVAPLMTTPRPGVFALLSGGAAA